MRDKNFRIIKKCVVFIGHVEATNQTKMDTTERQYRSYTQCATLTAGYKIAIKLTVTL